MSASCRAQGRDGNLTFSRRAPLPGADFACSKFGISFHVLTSSIDRLKNCAGIAKAMCCAGFGPRPLRLQKGAKKKRKTKNKSRKRGSNSKVEKGKRKDTPFLRDFRPVTIADIHSDASRAHIHPSDYTVRRRPLSQSQREGFWGLSSLGISRPFGSTD